MPFTPSKQHTDIFAWVDAHSFDDDGSQRALSIIARAGTGKTTTLQKICERIPVRKNGPYVQQDIIYLAFNKSAVLDVKARGLAEHVNAMTFNAIGFAAVRKKFPRANVDARKTRLILEENLSERDVKTFSSTIEKLVGLAKSQGVAPKGYESTGILPDTMETWEALIDRYNVEAPWDDERLMPRAIDLASRVLAESVKITHTIDFDDQLWLTMVLDLPMPRRYRVVLADEGQDLNPVQRKLLAKLMEKNGMLIVVGDDAQCIYGFRGSDVDSFHAIAKEYGATRLPLTVTYRCPTAVVDLAKRYVPDIEAAPGAATGEVVTMHVDDVKDWRGAKDLIVCRTNAPLVAQAYSFIRQKIPCRVAGRDFGAGLTALIKKLKPTDIKDLLAKLDAYRVKEVGKLVAAKKEHRVQSLTDKIDSLEVLALECDDLDALDGIISRLFSDLSQEGKIVLSSVHRAKGAEADRVFILRPDLMPFRMARLDWEIEQEKNLIYVAYTRARKTLVFLAKDKVAA